MGQRTRDYHDDPFRSPSQDTPPNLTYRWARATRSARFSGVRLSPFRMGILLIVVASLVLLHDYIYVPKTLQQLHQQILAEGDNPAFIPSVAFQPPEATAYRAPDSIDTFQSYRHHNTCGISSLDLHAPFRPLCLNRSSMLTAMSSGGRIGFDVPYMPRGCDMRWFTSEETCEILGRFDRVLIIGDSFLRHITGIINILIRKDMGYGAVTNWNFSDDEKRQCFCNEQFDVKACSVQGIYKTADVMSHDPSSLSCETPINVIMEEIVRTPAPIDEIARLKHSIGGRSKLPKAFIMGHGLWSDLDLAKTIDWLDTMISVITSQVGPDWKGLFLTPSAAGKEKPDAWIVSQGNKALMLYEEKVGSEVKRRGLDHLGTWNMSIQARKYDGVHLDLRGNMVKAMMIMNWLNLIDE